jgi:hypothetical protein
MYLLKKQAWRKFFSPIVLISHPVFLLLLQKILNKGVLFFLFSNFQVLRGLWGFEDWKLGH